MLIFRLTMILEKEQNHNEDIRMFIESQLRFEEDVDEELLQQIRVEILEKSSGIFLWVNLVVHQLNEVQRHDGRIKAVQQRLREIPEAAKQQPAPNGAMSLYGLFQDIIQKDEKDINELVRVTQIVFCARRPLHPKELYVLIHQEYDNPFDASEVSDKILAKHVLQVSKGLAEVTKSEEPTVQFIHETVREFLRDGGLESLSTQSVDRDGHEILKASCLKQIQAPVSEHLELLAEYRRRGDYRNSIAHQDIWLRRADFMKQANEKFPFLEYATKHVLFHAEEAEAMGIGQMNFLERFPMVEWVVIYNLFERYHTRRYNGTTTPILYILAEHGCDHLIKSSAQFTGQYAREIKGHKFPSPLVCAIQNGNFDTAWTLVGLDANNQPRNNVAPSRRAQGRSSYPLMPLLLEVDDLPLMRKVLEDRYATNSLAAPEISLNPVKSTQMIDLILNLAAVPGFPLVGDYHKHTQEDQEIPEPERSHTDFIFIRRAIEKQPSLLMSKVWGGSTMLEFAYERGCEELESLYLEYSGGSDRVLHRAAGDGDFLSVIVAHRNNANLASQDRRGRTALHLATRYCTRCPGECEAMVLYLISEEPSSAYVPDCEGKSALNALSFEPYGPVLSGPWKGDKLFEMFLQAGVDTNTVLRCHECDGHSLPLVGFFTIRGDVSIFQTLVSDDRCNLDGRDSFGRTALSWCLSHRHRIDYLNDFWSIEKVARVIGERLLQQPGVDVNSRDSSNHTILEHFIRHPFVLKWDLGRPFANTFPRYFVHSFLQSNRLDPNLRVSNNQQPLDLIVSLYDTWPAELGDIDSKLDTVWYADDSSSIKTKNQREFNQHLARTMELILGTRKVDISVQRRCAEKAAHELRRIIMGSIESMS